MYQKSIDVHKKRSDGKLTNWALGHVYGVAGEKDSAKIVLNHLLKKRESSYVPGYMIGVIYTSLGEDNKALEWFEIALMDGADYQLIFGLLHDPRLHDLRNNPKMIRLKKQLLGEEPEVNTST